MASPMYRQIAEDLRAQIEAKELSPGQQLRTELELREHYGASRNTVRDAIKLLTTLGLVETKPGQGTFVVRKLDPHVTILTTDPKSGPGGDITQHSGLGQIVISSDPQVEIQKATPLVAKALRIAEGSQVVSRHQKRHIDGTPWSMQTTFYPMGFVLKGADRLIQADDIVPGTVSYLADKLGLRQIGYRDWIKVRTPDATKANSFNLPLDGRVSLHEIFRTGFDQMGTPMRLTVSVYPTDRNQFIVNVGDIPES